MKIHYKGKYNLDPKSLPHGEHYPNAVAFKEAKDTKTLAIIANVISIVLFIVFAIPVGIRLRGYIPSSALIIGALSSLLASIPHEFLHAVCFKKDAYIYTNLKQGMLFVVGPETMSKSRFVFMSLLPNIVFGFIPYIIAMIFPSLAFFAVFGTVSITMGSGDYYNVFNCITQMPKGARTYLYEFNSYWYMPQDDE